MDEIRTMVSFSLFRVRILEGFTYFEGRKASKDRMIPKHSFKSGQKAAALKCFLKCEGETVFIRIK